MKRHLLTLLLLILTTLLYGRTRVIELSPTGGADNALFAQAFAQAATLKGRPVTIRLTPGIYRMKRAMSIEKLYYVSNTTSESEDSDPTKHIGLWMKGLENVTLDGQGSTLLLTGEMSAFILDSCRNITIKRLKIDNDEPTQTEMTVVRVEGNEMTVQVHPTSHYCIEKGRLTWQGDGWSFAGGIAQTYDPVTDRTWRSWSPMSGLKEARELGGGRLLLTYDSPPKAQAGWVFQMRDAIRDEVCGLVWQCRNVTFQEVDFNYLGNFGVVCQYSRDITFDHTLFAPDKESGRTNAGFADFIQASGCRGLFTVRHSRFAGAHDDPINIHGTHLRVVEQPQERQLRVRFMHGQTYGFPAFFTGDRVQITDDRTLLPIATARVKTATLVSPREILLTLDRSISSTIIDSAHAVVENITWCPRVHITGNHFSRIPTRGLLITTRRKAVVEGNTFTGMQMSGLLVADDALSWYESGAVHNLTVRDNTFIDCGKPVVLIEPESRINGGAVHRNITIRDNFFYLGEGETVAVWAKGVKNLKVERNHFYIKGTGTKKIDEMVQYRDCKPVKVNNNSINRYE